MPLQNIQIKPYGSFTIKSIVCNVEIFFIALNTVVHAVHVHVPDYGHAAQGTQLFFFDPIRLIKLLFTIKAGKDFFGLLTNLCVYNYD